jgi:hypothetical protein
MRKDLSFRFSQRMEPFDCTLMFSEQRIYSRVTDTFGTRPSVFVSIEIPIHWKTSHLYSSSSLTTLGPGL